MDNASSPVTGNLLPRGTHMNGSLYIGATGLKGMAEGMNVVTNNLANANTVGYKQQSMLFSDLIYESQAGMGGWWGAQQGSYVALGQVGKGVQVDSVRTLFTPGGYEMGIDITDLSIAGKGFFQVTTPDNQERYTRAGNFRFDKDGMLKLPDGSVLTGYPIGKDGSVGGPGPIKLDPTAESDPKATTEMKVSLNLGVTTDSSSSATDPYFGMVQGWQAGVTPPVASGYSQPLRVYGEDGTYQDLTLYVDGTPDPKNGTKVLEFVLGRAVPAPGTGSEMLMSGTLTFNGAGQLINMAAFTPTNGSSTDLTTWTPAPMANGVPQFTVGGQTIGLNMGVTAAGGWVNPPASAADVGTDVTKLPSMGNDVKRASNATTGYAGSSSQRSYMQDGYTRGYMTGLDITADGTMVASFTNGQSLPMWQIPICRFTSEDGLRREGNNLFSAGAESGAMEMGRAGTENYGSITAKSLEMSNVDMAREMVNMIITQRAFQSNSKVITTADAMLQKAMELKRS